MPLKQDERYFHVQKSYKNHTDINEGKKHSCQQNWGKNKQKAIKNKQTKTKQNHTYQ